MEDTSHLHIEFFMQPVENPAKTRTEGRPIFEDQEMVRIKFVGDSLQVVTDRGTAMAKPGDWVVFWSGLDDHLSIHSGEEFKKMFEEYDGERPPRIRSTTEKPRQHKPRENPA